MGGAGGIVRGLYGCALREFGDGRNGSGVGLAMGLVENGDEVLYATLKECCRCRSHDEGADG